VPQKSLTLETFLAGHGMIVGSDDNDGDLVLSLTNTKTIRQQHCLEVASRLHQIETVYPTRFGTFREATLRCTTSTQRLSRFCALTSLSPRIFQ
jgi:hypothetical protein